MATWELADYVQSQLLLLRAQIKADPHLSGLWIIDGDIVAAFMKGLARQRIVVVHRTPSPQSGKLGVLDCWFRTPAIADALRVPRSKHHAEAVRASERARARYAARRAAASAAAEYFSP